MNFELGSRLDKNFRKSWSCVKAYINLPRFSFILKGEESGLIDFRQNNKNESSIAIAQAGIKFGATLGRTNATKMDKLIGILEILLINEDRKNAQCRFSLGNVF